MTVVVLLWRPIRGLWWRVDPLEVWFVCTVSGPHPAQEQQPKSQPVDREFLSQQEKHIKCRNNWKLKYWGGFRQILEHENWMTGLAASWLHNPLPCWKFVKEYIKMTITTYLTSHFTPVVGLTLIWTVKRAVPITLQISQQKDSFIVQYYFVYTLE
jgi:hypothetical protein